MLAARPHIRPLLAARQGRPDYRAKHAWLFAVAGDNVPDLLDEMARTTLDDGGTVTTVCHGEAQVAARIRFPPGQTERKQDDDIQRV